MITWTPYKSSHGAYAEVGSFILEAHPNGSWVVRHVIGLVPARHSEMENTLNPGSNLASAKIKAAQTLNAMLAATGDVVSQMDRQQAITRKLCERYQAMRKAQVEGSQDAERLTSELDMSVAKYLGQDVRQSVNSDQTLAA